MREQSSFTLDYLPADLALILNEISEVLGLGKYDICSLDFAYVLSEKKRYLIEINSSPGIWFSVGGKELQHAYFTRLATYFTQIR